MTRDKTLDGIILKNFFKHNITFFTQPQPYSEDLYLQGYALASHGWVALRAELDAFSLSISMKSDLNRLFELAENFFYYVNSQDHPYRSQFMHQKWEEMRQLAHKIVQMSPSRSQ